MIGTTIKYVMSMNMKIKIKQTLNKLYIFQHFDLMCINIVKAASNSLKSINYLLLAYWTVAFFISILLTYVDINDIFRTLILYLSCPVCILFILYIIVLRTLFVEKVLRIIHIFHSNKTYFISKQMFTFCLISAISFSVFNLLVYLDIEFITKCILPHIFTSPFLILLNLNLVDSVVFMNTSGNSTHPGNAGGSSDPSGGAPEPPKSPNSSEAESNPDSKKKVDKGKGRAISVESDQSVEESSKKKIRFSTREERDASYWPEWVLNHESESDSGKKGLSPTSYASDDSSSILDTPSPINDYDSDKALDAKLEYALKRKQLDDQVRREQNPPLPSKPAAGPSKPRYKN
jgi:hypothetical protein